MLTAVTVCEQKHVTSAELSPYCRTARVAVPLVTVSGFGYIPVGSFFSLSLGITFCFITK